MCLIIAIPIRLESDSQITQLVDLTRTLGSERLAAVPGLIGVSMEPLHTHERHARSNTKLTLATYLGPTWAPGITSIQTA